MSVNTRVLNLFASGMADIQLSRNPLAEEVHIIFNDVQRDHYQDSVLVESCRIKKLAMVKKDTDMDYVQQEGFELLEDESSLPWTVSITTTGLPRAPRQDDQVLINGIRYNVSGVKPSNREIDSIILLFIYPDRTDEDELKLYGMSLVQGKYGDLVYGGNPVEIGFGPESTFNKELRIPFTSYPELPKMSGSIYIFDSEGNKSGLFYDFR